MNATLSPETQENLDTIMRLVARNVAMGIHDLNEILEVCGVDPRDFTRWQGNPRFQMYLRAEQEAWNNASNVGERAKLKAGILIEEWLPEAYGELRDRKTPLNQRTLLFQAITKVAGMGEPKTLGVGVTDGGGGFTLQINIGQHAHIQYSNENLKVIDAEPEPDVPDRLRGPVEEFEDINVAPEKPKTAYEMINDELGIPEDE